MIVECSTIKEKTHESTSCNIHESPIWKKIETKDEGQGESTPINALVGLSSIVYWWISHSLTFLVLTLPLGGGGGV
jgi:hypothetical protein